jgi:hypothetical protein
MMAVRTGMDIITIFNPFGAAGNLLVRGGLRLVSRLALRTTLFQIDEGFLADTGYSDLVYTAIDYIKQEVNEIIVGGN